jgi:hypothetical protein
MNSHDNDNDDVHNDGTEEPSESAGPRPLGYWLKAVDRLIDREFETATSASARSSTPARTGSCPSSSGAGSPESPAPGRSPTPGATRSPPSASA